MSVSNHSSLPAFVVDMPTPTSRSNTSARQLSSFFSRFSTENVSCDLFRELLANVPTKVKATARFTAIVISELTDATTSIPLICSSGLIQFAISAKIASSANQANLTNFFHMIDVAVRNVVYGLNNLIAELPPELLRGFNSILQKLTNDIQTALNSSLTNLIGFLNTLVNLDQTMLNNFINSVRNYELAINSIIDTYNANTGGTLCVPDFPSICVNLPHFPLITPSNTPQQILGLFSIPNIPLFTASLPAINATGIEIPFPQEILTLIKPHLDEFFGDLNNVINCIGVVGGTLTAVLVASVALKVFLKYKEGNAHIKRLNNVLSFIVHPLTLLTLTGVCVAASSFGVNHLAQNFFTKVTQSVEQVNIQSSGAITKFNGMSEGTCGFIIQEGQNLTNFVNEQLTNYGNQVVSIVNTQGGQDYKTIIGDLNTGFQTLTNNGFPIPNISSTATPFFTFPAANIPNPFSANCSQFAIPTNLFNLSSIANPVIEKISDSVKSFFVGAMTVGGLLCTPWISRGLRKFVVLEP
jgi:hypothetical protein